MKVQRMRGGFQQFFPIGREFVIKLREEVNERTHPKQPTSQLALESIAKYRPDHNLVLNNIKCTSVSITGATSICIIHGVFAIIV